MLPSAVAQKKALPRSNAGLKQLQDSWHTLQGWRGLSGFSLLLCFLASLHHSVCGREPVTSPIHITSAQRSQAAHTRGWGHFAPVATLTVLVAPTASFNFQAFFPGSSPGETTVPKACTRPQSEVLVSTSLTLFSSSWIPNRKHQLACWAEQELHAHSPAGSCEQ